MLTEQHPMLKVGTDSHRILLTQAIIQRPRFSETTHSRLYLSTPKDQSGSLSRRMNLGPAQTLFYNLSPLMFTITHHLCHKHTR